MNTFSRQRGIALPIMLLILLTMMLTSVYLLKSMNATTMTVSNVAYKSALSKAADLGLHRGFQWLSSLQGAAKAQLNNHAPARGYRATFDTTQTPTSAGFWDSAITITEGTDQIQYVIHRLCAFEGSYDRIGPPSNTCVQTAEAKSSGHSAPIGSSLQGDAPGYAGAPQLHYVITSRISGPRGGNVINQMVVLIGV